MTRDVHDIAALTIFCLPWVFLELSTKPKTTEYDLRFSYQANRT